MNTPETIDAYLSKFPPEKQSIMNKVRKAILEVVPDAVECISWGMPAFKRKKVLVLFAGHKNHLGLYPFPDTIEHFRKELELYHTSKGAIQFPYEKSLPLDLIKSIVKYNADKLAGGIK